MRVLGALAPGERPLRSVSLGQQLVLLFCVAVVTFGCSSPTEQGSDGAASPVTASASDQVVPEAPVSTMSHDSASAAGSSPGLGDLESNAEVTSRSESRSGEGSAVATGSQVDSPNGDTGREAPPTQTRESCWLTLFSLPGEYGLAAQFAKATSDVPLSQVTAGDCTLSEYAVPYEWMREYLDAGTIYLTGEGIDYPESYSLELTRSESGAYASDVLPTGQIPGRADLHIWSSGGVDVEAFELDLSFPLSLILTGPPVGPDGALQMSAGRGVELQWERGVEDVFLHIEGVHETDTRRYYMSCWFPSVPGAGSISAEVLAPFVGAQIDVHTVIRKELQVGMYDLDVRGIREVYNPDKSLNVWGEVVP